MKRTKLCVLADRCRTDKGPLLHNYTPLYDREIGALTEGENGAVVPLNMLEIGIFEGGSLTMWHNYLPAGSTVHAIDVHEPSVSGNHDPDKGVFCHLGSQDDREFLKRVVDEHGPFDVIIDDGSHYPRHQQVSLSALWWAVKPGGLYIIEDLHSSMFTFDEAVGVLRSDEFSVRDYGCLTPSSPHSTLQLLLRLKTGIAGLVDGTIGTQNFEPRDVGSIVEGCRSLDIYSTWRFGHQTHSYAGGSITGILRRNEKAAPPDEV